MADETLTTHAEDGIATGDVVAPHGREGVRGRPAAHDKDQPDLGPPSFAELVWAHYLWRRQLQELETRQARRELHVPLEAAYRRRLAAFERFNGRIVDAYWCRSEASAVAITAKPAKPFARNVMRRSSTMRFHSATDWKTARSPVIASSRSVPAMC